MSYKQGLTRKAALVAGLFCLLLPAVALAGAYLLSAHGSGTAGVARSVITSAGYGRGNCAHCHEMHASLAGVEPAPVSGAASPYALFAESLDLGKPYNETSNFCFSCHNSTGSAQQVTNKDYSEAFGGASADVPQSIMADFNQVSSHHLGDLKTFVNNSSAYPWFSDSGNPCNGCHNPHLAKRNWVSSEAGFPLLSAISKPSNHFSLWGESQLMSAYSSYEAPYSSGTNREPAGVGEANGSKTPDYVGFCTDCHNSTNTIWSTSLSRNLRVINWAVSGEKHGGFSRDVGIIIREPYLTASATKSNFVLSCLDCHEPHGSPNIMLLRRRINGENLEGTITATNVMGYACKRCHKDDLAAGQGTNQANKWRYIHHDAPDKPYNAFQCTSCHGAVGPNPPPIPCGNCHMHGMTDSWAPTQTTGRKTF